MDDKKILFSIRDGKVVEKTYYIVCDKFVDIDAEEVYSKNEINEYEIFESRNEVESFLSKPKFLPLEEKLKIIKELDLDGYVNWAFREYFSTKAYKVLEKLDINTELRYYLKSNLGIYGSKLHDEAKAILSALDVNFE